MKKRLIPIIIAIFALFLIIATNPSSKADYIDWVKENIEEEGGMFMSFISGPIIKATTTKKDMILFTIYETKFSDDKNDKLLTIGILNKFIMIKGFPKSSPD